MERWKILKKIEQIKKNPVEILDPVEKYIQYKLKNLLDGLYSKMEMTEKISELEDRTEIIEPEKQRKMMKN